MKTIRLSEYIRQRSSSIHKSSSYKSKLRNTASKIEDFEHFLGRELYTQDFDDRMMEEFDYFLRNNPKNLRRSTIGSLGANVAFALKKAKDDKYSVDIRYSEYVFPSSETCSVALTTEEIKRIFELKKLSEEQNNARFWFLFGCCTGLRFSDLKRVETINFTAENYIYIRTKKTNTSVLIPTHWMIKDLMKDFPELPKMKTQQSFNKIIKRLCRKAKINDKILIERHEGTKFVRKQFPKWQLITSHTVRRSFATNAYLSGIPVARIMLFTGHKTEESFFRYIKINKKENAKTLSNHKFFNR